MWHLRTKAISMVTDALRTEETQDVPWEANYFI